MPAPFPPDNLATALRQFVADRPAAQHQQAPGAACAVPRLSDVGSRLSSSPGIGGTKGPGAGGDDDGAGARVRVPSVVATSTVHGRVIVAAQLMTSALRPVWRSTESCGSTALTTVAPAP